MNIKDLLAQYKVDTGDKSIRYMAFISKITEVLPEFDRFRKLTEVDFSKEELLTLKVGLGMMEQPTVEELEEMPEYVSDPYKDFEGNELLVKDMERIVAKVDKVDAGKALKMVETFDTSKKRIRKIQLDHIHKSSRLFMHVLLKPYTYAFVPNVWRRRGKNHSLYSDRITKVFSWTERYVVVFNDAEILYIF